MKKKIILTCLVSGLSFLLSGGNSMANMFFSSSNYQNEILSNAMLLNDDDVIHTLRGDFKDKIDSSHVFSSGVNLVVRLKNIGNKGAWGTLLCNVEGYGDVQIYVPHLTPNMKEFVTFVIPLTGMIAPRSTGKKPSLKITWERLPSK